MPRTVVFPQVTRVRIDGAGDSWPSQTLGEVVYIGHRSIVFRIDGELAPLTRPGVGVMPDGAQLCERSEFENVRRMLRPGDAVDLPGWRSGSTVDITVDITAVDLSLPSVPASPPAVVRLQRAVAETPVPPGMAGRMARTLRSRAPRLAAAVVDGRDPARELSMLIGAGPGTTPTGDDIVLGFLAALRASGDSEGSSALGQSIHPLLPRTTETAGYFLRHAIGGRFAEHVHDAVTSLRSAERVDAVMSDAAHWGATSGADLLVGLAAGASVALTMRRAAA